MLEWAICWNWNAIGINNIYKSVLWNSKVEIHLHYISQGNSTSNDKKVQFLNSSLDFYARHLHAMQADVLLNTSHPYYFPNDNTFNQSWHSLHFPGRLGCSDMGSLPWSCSNCKTFTGLGRKSKRSWTGNEIFLFFSLFYVIRRKRWPVVMWRWRKNTCSKQGFLP